MLAEIARLTGRKPPWLKMPVLAVYPVAFVEETLARLTGREPFATFDGLRMARKKMFFSSAKAERALGYTHRPAVEGIADALAWFRAEGYVRS
jgi:dihydroflavonol-4-reductase